MAVKECVVAVGYFGQPDKTETQAEVRGDSFSLPRREGLLAGDAVDGDRLLAAFSFFEHCVKPRGCFVFVVTTFRFYTAQRGRDFYTTDTTEAILTAQPSFHSPVIQVGH